jgi:hypothetical protein
MAIGHIIHRIIVLIAGVRLIDRVVSQVHKIVIQILRLRQLIPLRRKPHQTFIVEVYPQRVATCQQHVYP